MLRPHWLGLALFALAATACSGRSVVGGPADAAAVDTGLDAPATDLGSDTGPADTGPADTGPADTGPADTGVDVPAADTGPTRCTGDGDCAGNPAGAVCDTASGRCVPCTPATDRCPTGQYCTTDNACAAGCRDDAACMPDGGMGGRCNPATRQCVQCLTDAHCAAGTLCVGNVCVMGCTSERPCPSGQTCCDSACLDTRSNIASCGACGNRCDVANAQAACRDGVCAVGLCTAPFADCDNDPRNGCEVNLNTDTNRCGACTTRCDLANATAACTMGQCAVAMCAAGFGDCDGNAANGCETNTGTSVSHCGACGTVCMGADNATPACAAGRCGFTCAAGFADCDGSAANGCEVNTTNTPSHCGACGRACAVPNGTAGCAMSQCTVARCNAGFADCNGDDDDGCETATVSNNTACGACGVRCAAGQVCAAGACVSDCRRSGAVACGDGTVCDYTDGQCRPTGARCLLTGEFAPCGAQRCGPGSACNPRTMACVPTSSCAAVACEPGTDRCWGDRCPCERPPAGCTTLAPTAVPSAFLSGAFGFDIDDACNLYTATMLSGPDYVRRAAPNGQVTTWTSVANLNMGEVSAQRRSNAGGGGEAANVAFTYICCASCGCASTPPQGVGHVQSNGSLPVVVPATVTSGTGPFGSGGLDTGPYGLSVSAVGEFFVGNVRANGDYFRYDVAGGSITAITSLPRRVTASTSFDLDTMLVAVEGGGLHLVDRAPGGTVRALGTLGADVQSVRRDTFTGRFYASLRDGRVVSFASDGTGVTTEASGVGASRIALSPDGWLYILRTVGGPITRIALPATR
jgi:hypothetical protein